MLSCPLSTRPPKTPDRMPHVRFAFHRDLALGRYIPLDTPVHRMDPRAKLAAFLALLIALFAAAPRGRVLVAAAIAAIAALARLPVHRIGGGLRALAWILLLTAAYHLVRLGALGGDWSLAGTTAAGAVLQLVGMLLLAAVLTHATEPVHLADGLAAAFGFLERFRVPVRDLALVLTLALRFLPTVLEEAQRIVWAQKARGARFEGGPLERGRRLLPLAVPLVAGCLRRADTLAFAMEARGFSTAARRTRLEPLAFRTADGLALAACGAVAAAGLALWR